MKKRLIYGSSCIVLILILYVLIYRNSIINWLQTYSTSNFRSILEILYFVTSPLLLIVTIIGLQQLTIAKNSSKMNAKREAFKLAAEQCKYFLEHIVPELNLIDNLMDEMAIDSLGKAQIKANNKVIEIECNINKSKKLFDILPQLSIVLNELEAFAVFFTSGVAEESVAFSSIGNTFVCSVDKFLPIVCMVQGKGYGNILKLYILWKDKIEKQDALQKKLQAEKKLNQNCTIEMKSIGI